MKLLICGDVKGNLDIVRARVQKLHSSAHGPFDALLCVGNFLGDLENLPETYQSGEVCFPLPVYIACGSDRIRECYKPGGGDLAKNLHYLGDAGVASVAGLQVAFLSGTYDSATYEGSEGESKERTGSYSKGEVAGLKDKVAKAGKPVDVLLTSEWGVGVCHGMAAAALPEGVTSSTGTEAAKEVAEACSPQYHFSATQELFFQRAPYKSDGSVVTRFLGLGAVAQGAPKSRKYLYAVNIAPFGPGTPVPAGCTVSPYVLAAQSKGAAAAAAAMAFAEAAQEKPTTGLKRSLPTGASMSAEKLRALEKEPDNFESGGSYRWNVGQRRGGGGGGGGGRRGPPPQDRTPIDAPCWFCLATPEVEKHLITSIGEEVYLALPKGGINEDHILVIPVSHTPSVAGLSDDSMKEIDAFKGSLHRYFASKGMGMVVFERYVKTRGAAHAHVQAIGVPSKNMARAEETFVAHGREQGIGLTKVDTSKNIREIVRTSYYFMVEVYGEGVDRLVHIVNERARFPLQFGREAFCRILERPDRLDWKACTPGKDIETELAADFRGSFAKFAPSS